MCVDAADRCIRMNDTLGRLPVATATSAGDSRPAQVAGFIGESEDLALAGQGHTGREVAADAAAHRLHLEVDDARPGARRGFVLSPRRSVVERMSAWFLASAAWLAGDGTLPRAATAGHPMTHLRQIDVRPQLAP
jgi:hypothetical protein